MVCGIVLLGVLSAVALRHALLPTPMKKNEIFRGVHYFSTTIKNIEGDSSRVMGFEIELDAPGVEFFIRPLDTAAVEQGAHYNLRWPDLEVLRQDLSVLINGVLYHPGQWTKSYPGAKVSAVESLIIDGELTHLDPHSYLIWFDETLLPHVETTKPPPAEAIRQAKWAIGVQGLRITDGSARHASSSDHDRVMKRTFIGVDPNQRKLWLLVFGAIDGYQMIDVARQTGIVHGGQLDSDDGTWGIVGPGAVGVRAMTGIRGLRPIASYIGIRALPVEQ